MTSFSAGFARAGLIFCGGGDSAIRAIDTLGRRATGTPMTFRAASGRQMVVLASGTGRDATLTAFE